jgi:hypothetical protein
LALPFPASADATDTVEASHRADRLPAQLLEPGQAVSQSKQIASADNDRDWANRPTGLG